MYLMWLINDSKIRKQITKLPKHVQAKYSYWRTFVINDGVEKLSIIRGFNFEKLSGDRAGQYSCRLSKGYRVIFEIYKETVTVYVLEVNKHAY